MTNRKLLIATLASIAFCSAASAKSDGASKYKWVDDKGRTHYSDTIPPEYANKDRHILNKSGTIVETQDVLTAEERRAQEADDAKSKVSESAARDLRLHDKALKATYSNVGEIELSRSRDIQQVDIRINSITAQLKTSNNSLLDLQREVENRTKAGNGIPASLHNDIKDTEERIKMMEQDLQKFQDQKKVVNDRYDADKIRYRELTGQ